MSVLYTAIFLFPEEKERLLKMCPPLHPKIFGDHVTLVFRPSPKQLEQLQFHINKDILVPVWGTVSDSLGQAVLVTVPEYLRVIPETGKDIQKHHITISCGETTQPSYSNKLLENVVLPEAPLLLEVRGIVRHYEKPRKGTG